MNAKTVDGVQAFYQRLQRLSVRSTALAKAALLLVHTAGCLLMASPPLLLVASIGGALYMSNKLQGPLDWFLIELLCALGLLGAHLTLQLFALHPEQPAGVAISEQQAPEVFSMLTRRISHFKMRPISQILLTTKAELRIVAAPALPLPLFHRYSLCIGAPITFFLSRDQFRLALAGAIAATAESHSRLTGRLLQACRDWPLILNALKCKENLLSHLFTKPLRHIATIADILGRPLYTDWRIQQGQWVLQNSDERNAMDYLANQVVTDAFLKLQYWPMILKAAERCPAPVVKAFSHLPLLLVKTLNRQVAERWLMQVQTAGDRRRSGVRDLLAELKLDHLRWSGLPTPNAFCVLFKNTELLKQLDQLWQHDIEPEWRRRHANFQNDRTRFEQLQRRALQGELRGESALRYLKLAPRFLDKSDARTGYHNVYVTNRDDYTVCFAAGVALLRVGAGDEGGQALLRASELEPSLETRAKALIDEQRQAWIRLVIDYSPGKYAHEADRDSTDPITDGFQLPQALQPGNATSTILEKRIILSLKPATPV